jgi:hypothetical protein
MVDEYDSGTPIILLSDSNRSGCSRTASFSGFTVWMTGFRCQKQVIPFVAPEAAVALTRQAAGPDLWDVIHLREMLCGADNVRHLLPRFDVPSTFQCSNRDRNGCAVLTPLHLFGTLFKNPLQAAHRLRSGIPDPEVHSDAFARLAATSNIELVFRSPICEPECFAPHVSAGSLIAPFTSAKTKRPKCSIKKRWCKGVLGCRMTNKTTPTLRKISRTKIRSL